MAAGDLSNTPTDPQSRDEILARERRWAGRVGIASIVAATLAVAGVLVQLNLTDYENEATQLISFNDHSGALLLANLATAAGVALFSFPLFYLFSAARARSDKVRGAFVVFAFLGPVLLAVRSVISWFATDDIAGQFSGGPGDEKVAEDLIEDSSFIEFTQALGIPAAFGMLVAMIYIPMVAMRQGLLTRFWGTLGMALGASLLFLGPIALFGLMLWFLYVGLMIGGWLPRDRPPAWEAGVAVPWPRPGDEIRDPDADPLAQRGQAPESVEGSGRELSEPPLPEDGVGSAEAAPSEGAGQPPDGETGMTQGQRRKKRKRRE